MSKGKHVLVQGDLLSKCIYKTFLVVNTRTLKIFSDKEKEIPELEWPSIGISPKLGLFFIFVCNPRKELNNY